MNKIFYFVLSFFVCSSLSSFSLERDEFIEEHLKTVEIVSPFVNKNYNYEAFNSIPIKLQIVTPLNSKKAEILEGQTIDFKVKENVKYNNKILI